MEAQAARVTSSLGTFYCAASLGVCHTCVCVRVPRQSVSYSFACPLTHTPACRQNASVFLSRKLIPLNAGLQGGRGGEMICDVERLPSSPHPQPFLFLGRGVG